MGRVSEETKQRTRERLLWTGADEFARAGLAGASIDRISLQAGLAKGTVYNYFESKEALFLAVVEETCKRVVDEVQMPKDASTLERLVALFAVDVRWVAQHEPFARVLVRESMNANERLYPKILQAAAPFLTKVAAALDQGVARGEVRDDLPTSQLALVLLGLYDLFLIQHWGTGGTQPALHDIPALVVGLFLEGALRRP